MSSSARTVIHLADYTPAPYMIEHIDLSVSLETERTRVHARMKLQPNPASPLVGTALQLDGEELVLEGVVIDGRRLAASEYSVDERYLTIPAVPQQPFTLEVTTLCNPAANTALSGLYRSNGMYCTQCEAEGFRRITYAYDRPDVMATYTVRMDAERDTCPVLLANGNPVEAGVIPDTDRHYAVWHDPHPKPTYLFALVAGDLAGVHDEFVTVSGRSVKLGIYVERGKENRCAFAMQALKESMAWDERRFGREYDLDVFNIVAVSDFNMGAMENKGLNIFNDKYILALPETATDQDHVNIEAIIAHEYFHNWTGNRITCRDWFQLCLKEGLTVFRDQEFTSDLRSRPVKRIADVQTLRARQMPEDAGPLAHPPRPSSYIEINNFYTPTVYEKGAEICRMLLTLLGEQQFRKAMDLYFERHDGEAATVEQFVQCFADVSGRDLSQFFRWYEQAGTPVVTVATAFDAAAKTFTLTLSQETRPTPGQATKQPQHIPLRLGLVGQNGQDLPLLLDGGQVLSEPLIELREAQQSFRFTGVGQRPVLSINRGFSAPVILKSDQSSQDRLFLLGHDSDSFNRWEAAQVEALALLTATVQALAEGVATPDVSAFATALAQSVSDQKLDQAFRGLLLALPTEAAICGAIGKDVDTDLVHAARTEVRRAIGYKLSDSLRNLLRETESDERYMPSPAATGRRALRYAALALLTAANPQEGQQLARKEFDLATHMTAEIGALTAMLTLPAEAADAVLDIFYARHANDPLLIDKWFMLKASVPASDAASRIEQLTRHKAFSFTTPNRVYALLGGFTSGNIAGFNAADGSGYKLMADMVLKLDRSNPQVAARMAGSFRSWQQMNAVRKEHARQQLKRIVAEPNLSPDSFEIASKMLDEKS